MNADFLSIYKEVPKNISNIFRAVVAGCLMFGFGEFIFQGLSRGWIIGEGLIEGIFFSFILHFPFFILIGAPFLLHQCKNGKHTAVDALKAALFLTAVSGILLFLGFGVHMRDGFIAAIFWATPAFLITLVQHYLLFRKVKP